MKLPNSGFYVSLDGNQIIEVHSVRWNVHTGLYAIIEFQGSHLVLSGGDTADALELILTNWEYLG